MYCVINGSHAQHNTEKTKPSWQELAWWLLFSGAGTSTRCFSVCWRCSSGIFTAPDSHQVVLRWVLTPCKKKHKLLLFFVAWSQEDQKIVSCPFCRNRPLLCHYFHHLVSHSCFKEKEWTLLGVETVWCWDLPQFGFFGACYTTSKEIDTYGILHKHNRLKESCRHQSKSCISGSKSLHLLHLNAIETGLLGFTVWAKGAESEQKGEIKLFVRGCTEKLQ